MLQLRYQHPELQVAVETIHGRFETDFRWPRVRRFGEFDGYLKYTRNRETRGRSIEDIVLAEKVREDAIRARTGDSFLRWLWRDALVPATFDRMLRDAGIPSLRGIASSAHGSA